MGTFRPYLMRAAFRGRTHRSGTGLWRSDGYELLRQGLFQPRHCQIEERSHFNRQKPVGGVDEVNWHRRWMKFV